jgi:thiamine-phosphate pyrophosphorylase
MPLQLPRVYPITDTHLSGLSHAEQVRRLIDGGATLTQLRDKQSTSRDFYNDAKAALQIAHAGGVRLIINDRVDIALALRADGVHLGQTDMPVESARRLLGERAIIGISTHNLLQVRLASQTSADYIAFGPIFKTSTKTNPEPVAGLDALPAVRAIITDFPLVAIGGVTVSNARQVWAAGADSVSSVAALLSDAARIPHNLREMLARASATPWV